MFFIRGEGLTPMHVTHLALHAALGRYKGINPGKPIS